MADEIDTGGGPAVSGNADSGRDFVGRDHNTYNTHASLDQKSDWVAFFLMGMRNDVQALMRTQEEARQDRARMDVKIDRNHDHTAARFADSDKNLAGVNENYNRKLDAIWSWLIAIIVGYAAHLVAIVVLIIIIYMMWQTVYDDAVAALYRAAWIWGVP